MQLHSSYIGTIAVAVHARGHGGFHWSIIVPVTTTRALQFHSTQLNPHIDMWGFMTSSLDLEGSMSLATVFFIGTNHSFIISIRH